jgi:hypothetical protein
MKLRIDRLRLDGGTQPRAAIDESAVRDYADALGSEAAFPPVTVFHDGEAYWLADGFHRVHAHKMLDWLEIESDVRQGTRRDAVLFSVGANAVHGLRRTNADKRRAVETLLGDPEWAGWSDRDVSRRCGVSHEFVRQQRPSLSTVDSESLARTYTTKHGTQATMQVSSIGKRPTPAPAAPETAPAGVDAETGEILGATFPPEMLRAAHAPMSPAPWMPPQREDVMAESRLREASIALNQLEHKLSQLNADDFDLPLTGEALRFRLIATAEAWLRIFQADIPADRKTLDMVADA